MNNAQRLPLTAGACPAKARRGAAAAAAASVSSVLSQSTESAYYRAVARLGIQVAQALAHAHSKGSSTAISSPRTSCSTIDGHVWITDFGLAKLEGSEGPTQTGDIVGTLRYMAPERFEGWSDRRSDMYGLGMTLYELLTLRPGIRGGFPGEVDRAGDTRARRPSPRKHDVRVPRDLETIVMKVIAKEPGERYATAETLSADLENFVDGQADPGSQERPARARHGGGAVATGRPRRLVGVTGLAVLTLVGLGVALLSSRGSGGPTPR